MKTSRLPQPHDQVVATSRHTRPWPPVEGRREARPSDGVASAEPDPGPSSVATLVPTGSSCRPERLDGDEVFLEEAKTSDRRLGSIARLREEADSTADISQRGAASE